MEKNSIRETKSSALSIQFPPDLEKRLRQIANQKGEALSEIVIEAVSDFVADHARQRPARASAESLENARALMRQLGNGLGEGKAPHDGARNHDRYSGLPA